jgi:hypothetical protein
MRRTIVRYLNLSLILVFRLICLPVKKRFPSLEHLLAAGILEPKEMEVLYCFNGLRTFFNFAPEMKLAPRGEICPLGVKFVP